MGIAGIVMFFALAAAPPTGEAPTLEGGDTLVKRGFLNGGDDGAREGIGSIEHFFTEGGETSGDFFGEYPYPRPLPRSNRGRERVAVGEMLLLMLLLQLRMDGFCHICSFHPTIDRGGW